MLINKHYLSNFVCIAVCYTLEIHWKIKHVKSHISDVSIIISTSQTLNDRVDCLSTKISYDTLRICT